MGDEEPAAIPDVLAEVGRRLRRLRERRGVTLTALAAQTGISKSTLSRLESGQRRPSLELLLPLAKAHHLPLDEFVGAPRRRPSHPQPAPHPQRAARLSPRGTIERHGRVEGRHPAGERSEASNPRRLRMAVRPLRGDAADPRRARPDAARRRGRRVRHPAAALVRAKGDEPVEILSIHGSHGRRMHIRAAPRTRETV
jgi:transcriptional regulator with XRE-family HTH domain